MGGHLEHGDEQKIADERERERDEVAYKQGRPPMAKHLRRSTRITVSVTADEAEELKAAAQRRGVTVSQYLRSLGIAKLRKASRLTVHSAPRLFENGDEITYA